MALATCAFPLNVSMTQELASGAEGTTTPLSHIIRSQQECLGLKELELSECEQHVLVAKLAARVHQSAIMSH